MSEKVDLLKGYVPESEWLRIRKITRVRAQQERRARVGPAWVRLGRAIYYSVDGIAEFLASNEVKPLKKRRG
jgi:hypothetical protein